MGNSQGRHRLRCHSVDRPQLARRYRNGNRGRVIILSAEGDAADMIVPRLIAAGGPRPRRHRQGGRRWRRLGACVQFATDLDRLAKEYDLKEVRLVLIDPVSAYLGSAKGKPSIATTAATSAHPGSPWRFRDKSRPRGHGGVAFE